MQEIEKRVLTRVRSQLVKEMVVTESFLTTFCQSDLLDESIAAIIRAETNFEKRASKLLETLPHLNTRAFFTLMDILEITNPWLSEKMKTALHDERTRDAKINIHPSMAKNASIEGFGHARVHIDPDIKERSTKFVRTNLYHLTEVEQRGVDKWLADELQRERRRQQFRAPHDVRRDCASFQSSKETQTDTCSMDLREMYDELAIYLHGVDYDDRYDKISFQLIQQEVKELLGRTKKLDNLFLNCWNKFDDTNKYSMELPDLIDRTVHREKRLMANEELNKQMIHRLKEERDSLKRRIHKLEEDRDKLLQRQASVIPPQEMQLRHRQNIHLRYTFPCPADSNMMVWADNESDHSAPSSSSSSVDPNVSQESKPVISNNNNASRPIPNTNTNSCSSHRNNETHGVFHGKEEILSKDSGKAAATSRNGSHKTTTTTTNGHTNITVNGNRINGAAGFIHRAEPVHFEEKGASASSACSDDYNATRSYLVRNSHDTVTHNRKRDTHENANTNNKRGADGEGDRNVIQNGHDNPNHNMTNHNNSNLDNGPKIRRHASEESLRVAISREEASSSSTSRLNNSDLLPRKLSIEDLPSAVAQQGREPVSKQQQTRVSRVDLQSKMQKILTSHRQAVDAQRQRHQIGGNGNAANAKDTPKPQRNEASHSGNKGSPGTMTSRDTSPSFKGKTSLQASYEIIHNFKNKQKESMVTNQHTNSYNNVTAPQGNVNNPKHKQQKQSSDQRQYYQNQNRQILHEIASRYNGTMEEANAKHEQVERYVHHGHPYRNISNERTQPSAHTDKTHSPVRSTTNHNHFHVQNSFSDSQLREYTSDSELVLKPSNLRAKTARGDRSRGRVRFASPIARTTPPHRKASGRTQRSSHYQMDTASTIHKKIQK